MNHIEKHCVMEADDWCRVHACKHVDATPQPVDSPSNPFDAMILDTVRQAAGAQSEVDPETQKLINDNLFELMEPTPPQGLPIDGLEEILRGLANNGHINERCGCLECAKAALATLITERERVARLDELTLLDKATKKHIYVERDGYLKDRLAQLKGKEVRNESQV